MSTHLLVHTRRFEFHEYPTIQKSRRRKRQPFPAVLVYAACARQLKRANIIEIHPRSDVPALPSFLPCPRRLPAGLPAGKSGPVCLRLLAHPVPGGGAALPVLLAVPIVRASDREPRGGDLCAPQLVAQAAGTHAGEVARAAPRGGCYVSRAVVPSARGCVVGGRKAPHDVFLLLLSLLCPCVYVSVHRAPIFFYSLVLFGVLVVFAFRCVFGCVALRSWEVVVLVLQRDCK